MHFLAVKECVTRAAQAGYGGEPAVGEEHFLLYFSDFCAFYTSRRAATDADVHIWHADVVAKRGRNATARIGYGTVVQKPQVAAYGVQTQYGSANVARAQYGQANAGQAQYGQANVVQAEYGSANGQGAGVGYAAASRRPQKVVTCHRCGGEGHYSTHCKAVTCIAGATIPADGPNGEKPCAYRPRPVKAELQVPLQPPPPPRA